MPGLTNSRGDPTGAILGVSNMVRGLLNQFPTDRFAVVFDAAGRNFRHELYPEYKANRSKMPDSLAAQIGKTYKLLRALGLPVISVAGVEADDVIGTIALAASADGVRTTIVSGDKDLAQLVSAGVRLIDTSKGKKGSDGSFLCMYEAQVMDRFGVPPNRIAEYVYVVVVTLPPSLSPPLPSPPRPFVFLCGTVESIGSECPHHPICTFHSAICHIVPQARTTS
jgi:DNA polymerase-1